MNPLSWERSSYDLDIKTTKKSSKSSRSIVKSMKLDLLTFGYSCKLFNDEEQARFLEKGNQLIPFDGDNNLLIDR